MKPLSPDKIQDYYDSLLDDFYKLTGIDLSNLIECLLDLPIKLSGQPQTPIVHYDNFKFYFVLSCPNCSYVLITHTNSEGKEESICRLTLTPQEYDQAKKTFGKMVEKYTRITELLPALEKLSQNKIDVEKLKAEIYVVEKRKVVDKK